MKFPLSRSCCGMSVCPSVPVLLLRWDPASARQPPCSAGGGERLMGGLTQILVIPPIRQVSLPAVAFQPGFCLPFPSNVQLLLPNGVFRCLGGTDSPLPPRPSISTKPPQFPPPSCLFPPFCLLSSNQQNPAQTQRSSPLAHYVPVPIDLPFQTPIHSPSCGVFFTSHLLSDTFFFFLLAILPQFLLTVIQV